MIPYFFKKILAVDINSLNLLVLSQKMSTKLHNLTKNRLDTYKKNVKTIQNLTTNVKKYGDVHVKNVLNECTNVYAVCISILRNPSIVFNQSCSMIFFLLNCLANKRQLSCAATVWRGMTAYIKSLGPRPRLQLHLLQLNIYFISPSGPDVG